MSKIDKVLYDQYCLDLNLFCQRCFEYLYPNVALQWNWHIELSNDVLQSILKLNGRKVFVNMPPRYLKSFIFSIAFPAWALGVKPGIKIIIASYSKILSGKHLDDCRKIMDSDWYSAIFSKSVIDKKRNSKYRIENISNGSYLATSVGGTITGEGGDILILDDPINAIDAVSKKKRDKVLIWFNGSFMTRLNSKKESSVVVVHQRLHCDDISGYLYSKKSWLHFCIQAIADKSEAIEFEGKVYKVRSEGGVIHPDREGLKEIEEIKKELGSFVFEAQYQQNPMPEGSDIFKLSWLKFYDDIADYNLDIYVSVDTASSASKNSDYTAISIIGVDESDPSGAVKYYIIDIQRGRWRYSQIKATLIKVLRKHDPNLIFIENKSVGPALIEDLRCQGWDNCRPVSPKDSKMARFNYFLILSENGNIFMPKNCSFSSDFINEVISFPKGQNDDQVDSVTQFLKWHSCQKRARKSPKVRYVR